MSSKACVIVMDSVGVGALPDAEKFGDRGANTVGNIARRLGELKLPNLGELGFGNLTEINGTPFNPAPRAAWGKLNEKSAGKDTSIGHWELMGVYTGTPFNVFPDGFPAELISEFEARTGCPVIGNKPASGTDIIKELGPRQKEEKALIVYTSADSVFQIAAHEDIWPIEEQYKIADIARELCDKYGVVRVIARPYVGEYPDYKRTTNRKDISVPPGKKSLCEYLAEQGVTVTGIGKTSSIFADRGFSRSFKSKTNMDGVDQTISCLKDRENGSEFIFTNLVEFDSEYGHRRNVEGYARALEELDSRIPEITASLEDGDLLIFTADHGNDPTAPGSDHTREYVPLLVAGKNISGVELGIRDTFADVAASLKDFFKVSGPDFGRSFLPELGYN